MANAQRTPTLLNMGGFYPNHLLTLVIYGENLPKFPEKPEVNFINKEFCVTGLVIDYRGKPEIILTSPDQIKPADAEKETTNSTISTTPDVPLPNSTINASKPAAVSNTITPPPIKRLRLFNDVMLRTGPGFNYSTISKVKAGSVVSILFSSNGWSQVTVNTNKRKNSIAGEGYIKNSVLKGK